MPHRLDFVRFQVGDDELQVAFTVALEFAERAEQAADDDARSAATRIRGAGASRPVRLSADELTALARVDRRLGGRRQDGAPAARTAGLVVVGGPPR